MLLESKGPTLMSMDGILDHEQLYSINNQPYWSHIQVDDATLEAEALC